MAGIGFQLRKLALVDTLSSLVGAAGHAVIVAAGPWLFTIFSLAATTVLAERMAGLATLSTFRVIIIYAFAISLVVSAPVVMTATRLVADALWSRRPETVRPLMFGGFLLAIGATLPVIAVLLIVFPLPAPIAMALAANAALVGMIWVALAFCGAVRDYWGVTLSFVFGLLVSMIASIAAAAVDLGAAGMAFGFLSGLTVTLIGLTRRVLATFPPDLGAPAGEGTRIAALWGGAGAIVRGFSEYWQLALGALAGTLGVWIDKWVFWAGPTSETVEGGLPHAPLYDSALFLSSLVIIPSLASFVVRLETGFFDRYQRYYSTIRRHGTYGQIEAARRELASYTLDNLTLVSVAQAGLCALLVLVAPLVVDLLNLQFRQIAILRFGALGAVFQFLFIAFSSFLLFFDRRGHYLMVQTVFLLLMLGLTVFSAWLGEDYYGTGYFLACLTASLVAFLVADSTFRNLNYLTFIGNNPSIMPSTASRSERSRRRAAATRH